MLDLDKEFEKHNNKMDKMIYGAMKEHNEWLDKEFEKHEKEMDRKIESSFSSFYYTCIVLILFSIIGIVISSFLK